MTSILSSHGVFAGILAVLTFAACIFVHELGHFLAARKCGLKILRFSIGFGPKLFSWTRGGVEYRVSLLPFGGYVALPQLADFGEVEGGSSSESLPSVGFWQRVFVAAAGPFFNLVFAFCLACVLWFVGFPQPMDTVTTTIGHVADSVRTADGSSVASPASLAGLRVGDAILEVDGQPATSWMDVRQLVMTGSGRANGGRSVELTVSRDGRPHRFLLVPVLGADSTRALGIGPAVPLFVKQIEDNSAASRAGLLPGDRVLEVNGEPVEAFSALFSAISEARQEVSLTVDREGQRISLVLEPSASPGFSLSRPWTVSRSDPLTLLAQQARMTLRVLGALVSPYSDFSVRKVSGPPGMAFALYDTALIDTRILLWLVILINLNLAIFNLLPIPVLDGGIILFASLSKLIGRELPRRAVLVTQTTFFALLFGLILFLSFNDIAARFLS